MELKELLVNDKTTGSSRMFASIMSNHIKRYNQWKWTLKDCYTKIVFKNHSCNPFQSFSSLSIRAFFCIAVLFITSFNVFFFSLNLVTVANVTQLLFALVNFSWNLFCDFILRGEVSFQHGFLAFTNSFVTDFVNAELSHSKKKPLLGW